MPFFTPHSQPQSRFFDKLGLFVLFIALFGALSSCAKKAEPMPAPVLEGYWPFAQVQGGVLTIVGKNLSSQNTKVSINNTQLAFASPAVSRAKDSLWVRVPADMMPGYHLLSIQQGGQRRVLTDHFAVTRPKRPTILTTSRRIAKLSVAEVRTALTRLGTAANMPALSGLGLFVKGGIEVYSYKYMTTYKGRMQASSAILVIPRLPDPSIKVTTVGFCHSTITRHKDAPTPTFDAFFSASPPADIGDVFSIVYGMVAPLGFACVIPDYLGFGASAGSVTHPFYHEESLANDVAAALEAGQLLAEQKNVALNSKLVMAGYSLGGYVSLAAHKKMEAEPVQGLTVFATFSGAGAYDLTGMYNHMRTQTTYSQPVYLPYLCRSYEAIYGMSGMNGVNVSNFIKAPYVSRLPMLFNGTQSLSQVSMQLTTRVADLIVEGFLKRTGPQENYAGMHAALRENSLLGWRPISRIDIYHGAEDQVVPIANSRALFDNLSATSVSSMDFHGLAGNHTTAAGEYASEVLTQLNTNFSPGADEEGEGDGEGGTQGHQVP